MDGSSDIRSSSAPAPQEALRLAALRDYGVLDTAPEPAFEDITRIAAYVCRTPIAVINFIDDGRQWFKSEIGLGVRETPLDTSFCAHAILQPGLMIVPDASRDPRFACNPLVTGEANLRFYAGALLQTADGHAIGTVCVLDTVPRDLTPEQGGVLLALARQVMTQLELRRTLALAEKAARYRSQLLAVAGHDLRQPLQVMSMVLDQVARRSTDPKEKDRLDMALDAGRRLASDLDGLARASELAGDAPSRVSVAIADVLEPLRDAWAPMVERKGLKFTIGSCARYVDSEPNMLSTVLGNLVGNAIKYTDRGEVSVHCREEGDRLEISVEDTGRGIPAERLDTIFDAFRQLDRDAEGLGLGLAIVRRTSELLGLELRVRSELGRGSTFTVLVPLAHAVEFESLRTAAVVH